MEGLLIENEINEEITTEEIIINMDNSGGMEEITTAEEVGVSDVLASVDAGNNLIFEGFVVLIIFYGLALGVSLSKSIWGGRSLD